MKLAQRAAIASVCVALFLLALKAYAAFATGSVSMLASLADTALDLVASIATLYGVRVALIPADEDHRFGHGKAEALAALFQVGVIAVSAVAIFVQAIGRLFADAVPGNAEYGIGVSVLAIAVTLVLLAYQRHVIRATGSVAISADNVHYQSDLLTNIAVIAALALDQFGGLRWADPVFGIAIAAWLAWGASRAGLTAVDQLMDKEWPEERRRRFVEAAATIPEIKSLHDLRTRTTGSLDFAQFHCHIDAALTVEQAHDIVEAIEDKLAVEFPGVEVFIHVDPEGRIDHPNNPLVEADELAAARRSTA